MRIDCYVVKQKKKTNYNGSAYYIEYIKLIVYLAYNMWVFSFVFLSNERILFIDMIRCRTDDIQE